MCSSDLYVHSHDTILNFLVASQGTAFQTQAGRDSFHEPLSALPSSVVDINSRFPDAGLYVSGLCLKDFRVRRYYSYGPVRTLLNFLVASQGTAFQTQAGRDSFRESLSALPSSVVDINSRFPDAGFYAFLT